MNGSTIRIIRAMYGLTQTELGERLGVSDVYIAYMENGKRRVTDAIETRIRSELELTDEQIRELFELSRSVRRTAILGNIPRAGK
ncbi:helix-turn-helix transcriptional regulator [Paenibacillus tarimensis]